MVNPEGHIYSQKLVSISAIVLLQTSAAGGPRMDPYVGRRKCLAVLGGALVWPLAARAQQDGRVRRVGVLVGGAQSDQDEQHNLDVLRDHLAKSGWVEGRNVRFDLRWGAGDDERMSAAAVELVSLAADVIITSTGAATRAAQRATQRIPIVFTAAGDAIANGLVRNITRPEGNTTGFSGSEPTIAAKRLELLKESAPHVSRVAIIFNPDITLTAPSYIAAIEAAAPALFVQAVTMPFRDAVDIVRAIDAFAAAPDGGLIVLPPPPAPAFLDAILRLALQHRLPGIYGARFIATAGGLLVYASDNADRSRQAASYVDRLLRGTKVSELPVQFPTSYKLIVNLKAARAIGLDIPATLTARADEVMQ
jgi:putative tryptophan/tyrosine transport system substrate-binding protein